MDSDSRIKVLFIDSAGAITCNLGCPEPSFLYDQPDQSVTLAEFRDALIQHFAHHHPTLVAMLVEEWRPRTRSRQHCVSTEHSCAIDAKHDDHPSTCCDCGKPLFTMECRVIERVDPLHLDGR